MTGVKTFLDNCLRKCLFCCAVVALLNSQVARPQSSAVEHVYPISGEVSAPLLISKVAPAYPDELRKHDVHGTIVLAFVVAPFGSPRNIEISRGLNFQAKQGGHSCDSRLAFRPANRKGKPVSARVTAEVQYGPWLENKETKSSVVPGETDAWKLLPIRDFGVDRSIRIVN